MACPSLFAGWLGVCIGTVPARSIRTVTGWNLWRKVSLVLDWLKTAKTPWGLDSGIYE